jgi:hypothetical protein
MGKVAQKKLKGFKDYTDFLSYAKISLHFSDAGNGLLYDYLLAIQDTTDPIQKMREMTAVAYVKNFGEDHYRRLMGESSLPPAPGRA